VIGLSNSKQAIKCANPMNSLGCPGNDKAKHKPVINRQIWSNKGFKNHYELQRPKSWKNYFVHLRYRTCTLQPSIFLGISLFVASTFKWHIFTALVCKYPLKIVACKKRPPFVKNVIFNRMTKETLLLVLLESPKPQNIRSNTWIVIIKWTHT